MSWSPERAAALAGRPALHRLLTPSSVAVVGATDRPGSFAAQTLHNLTSWRRGRVVGVHPRRRSVLGFPCVPTLRDLDGPVDAVAVATPAATVVEQVHVAGEVGCGGAVVYADQMTGEQTAQLVAVAAECSLPVLGPNTNGVVDIGTGTALWGDPVRMPAAAGEVAVVTQSGNVGVQALAHRFGAGLHSVVAIGNTAVVSAADVLLHLAQRRGAGDGPRVVALYLEDDGDGARMAAALAECARHDLRIAVLKAGRTAASRAAAQAHTEALAGPHRVFAALVAEAGGVVVDDVPDLFESARALTAPRRSGKLAVMTCSGADAAVAADLAATAGVPLARLGDGTRARLRELLPGVAMTNPLDHTNRVWADRAAISDLVETVARDEEVGHLIYVQDEPAGLPPGPALEWRTTRDAAREGAQRRGVPLLLVAGVPGQEPGGPASPFVVSGLRPALAAVAALRRGAPDADRLHAVARAAFRFPGSGTSLPEHEAKSVLAAHGIPTPAGQVAQSPDEAVEAARAVGMPCAIKVSTPGMLHKSALGAVVTGVRDPAAVHAAAVRLLDKGSVLLVERMAPPGVEVLVAARADGVIPVLVVGMGGQWTEVLDDVAVVPLPADSGRVTEALLSLRGASLLAEDSMRALAAVATGVGTLLLRGGWQLIELNPVLAGGGTAVAVDAVLVPAVDDADERP